MLRGLIRPLLLAVLVFVVVSPLAVVAAPPGPGGTYIVQRGDTLARIAGRLGVSQAALASANGVSDANRIYAGQTLVVPGASGAPAQPAQTSDSGQATTGDQAPGPSEGIYVVKRGDTLSSIAERMGISLGALLAANALPNGDFVYVGQRLVIPGQDAQSEPAPEPVPTPVPTAEPQVAPLEPPAIATEPAATAPPDASADSSAGSAGANPDATPETGASPDATVSQDGPHPTPEGASPDAVEAVRAPEEAAKGERWIDVNLSAQSLTAYEGKRPVFTTRVSSGRAKTPTVAGNYKIYVKVPSQTMTGPGYRLPGVPYVMFFYKGYGIHGTYWHNNFGHPMSHGCVNVSTPDAAWLYGWAKIGTRVFTHY